jgi:aldehyde:ferredoxin oxidoreductase
MPFGYHGKILHVDLSTESLEIETPPESFYRFYMGGSALALHYVLAHTPPGADPLGPDNVLVLALSVLTGTPISGQSRMTAVARSPLTNAIGDSQCGGFWPAELKFAGFDALVVRGQADRPVYLWLKDGEAELRDAAHLWGERVGFVEDRLKHELNDDKIEVLQCGPAGERGVRFAALINMKNRANGRTGMGAVMGSKRLKAVVVRGTSRPEIADSAGLRELARWGPKNLSDSGAAGLAKYGTAETVMPQQIVGGLPTRNWESGVMEGAEAISGEVMYDTILRGAAVGKQDRLGRDTCYACTVRCKRVVEIEAGEFPVDPAYGGPEYETLATFGSYCGINDLAAIARANQLCNEYGMDTISCGATIAWAFACFDAGLITAEDTGGLDLSFGNAGAMVRLTELIGEREGFGALLGEGSAAAADTLGRGTEAYVVAAKKMELPAHMPEVKRSLGLIYAVNPFGADHQSSEHDPAYEGDFEDHRDRLGMLGLDQPQEPFSLSREKVRFALQTELLYSCLDSVNVCQFVFGPAWQLYGPDQLVAVARAITGWNVTLEELMRVGERRLNMMRAYNAGEGMTRNDDRLPGVLAKALRGGPTDGLTFSPELLERAKDHYYELCGWDNATGNPTPEKLRDLGLDWVVARLPAT